MIPKSLKTLLAAAVLWTGALPALADQTITIDGQVAHPGPWTMADLQGLPPVTIRVANSTDHGDIEAVYTGALLWSVLGKAAPIDGPGDGAHLRRTILVTGDDGYAVVVASGEIDPDSEGKRVIIAYATNGKPNAPDQGLRLIVPGDKGVGRNVRRVSRITVDNLGEQPKAVLPGPLPPPPPLNRFGP